MDQTEALNSIDNAEDKQGSVAELLNTVAFTVDPKLDDLELKNTLSIKAKTAKKIFSNYRKSQF